MGFKKEINDIIWNYGSGNEYSSNDIVEQIMDNLKQKVFECHDDLIKNEDFILEDIILYEDGIKWFVQEYLNKNE